MLFFQIFSEHFSIGTPLRDCKGNQNMVAVKGSTSALLLKRSFSLNSGKTFGKIFTTMNLRKITDGRCFAGNVPIIERTAFWVVTLRGCSWHLPQTLAEIIDKFYKFYKFYITNIFGKYCRLKKTQFFKNNRIHKTFNSFFSIYLWHIIYKDK